MTKLREYTCVRCKGRFVTETTDEEAEAEALRLYGVALDPDEVETICHECYKKFLERFYAEHGGLH